jgi:hypothetical protein
MAKLFVLHAALIFCAVLGVVLYLSRPGTVGHPATTGATLSQQIRTTEVTKPETPQGVQAPVNITPPAQPAAADLSAAPAMRTGTATQRETKVHGSKPVQAGLKHHPLAKPEPARRETNGSRMRGKPERRQ